MAKDPSFELFGDDPFAIARRWLDEARQSEVNDPDAAALATADQAGIPNVRMVLIRIIERESFVFFTNYGSTKATEIETAGTAAFVMHWKSLRRQLRVRGPVTREDGQIADDYFASRSLRSRLGAWASRQSMPLASRADLLERVADFATRFGEAPPRPKHWGGFRIHATDIEFWVEGENRLHDRLCWRRPTIQDAWQITRLSP